MNIPFSPAIFEMALQRLGIAAGQLKNLDTETKKALMRFVFTALQSGDANAYIKGALAHVQARDEKAEAPPEPQAAYKASTRPVPDGNAGIGATARTATTYGSGRDPAGRRG